MALSLFQERMNQLSAKAVSVEHPEEFNRVFSDLRAALRGQLAHLREMVDDAKETISRLPAKAILDPRATERRKGERRKSHQRKVQSGLGGSDSFGSA
jgi:ERCC4-related helicase